MANLFVFVTFVCLLLFGTHGIGGFERRLSEESLNNLRKVHDRISNSSGAPINWYEKVTELFREGRNATATYVDLNIADLRKDTCSNLTSKIFSPRRDALDKLVIKAQELAKNYSWNKQELKVAFKDANQFDGYHVASGVDENANRFPVKVNFSFSTVHVPVDTYVGEGSVENATLKELDWTNGLDKLFEEREYTARNNSDYEDFMWQYFGSQEGFVRHYPGSPWPKPDEVDLYDSRRRPWYNRAATTPKEVLILIDTSGSTAGQTLYLMTLTVQKLLDTLGEDDFVQVANFSNADLMKNHRARLGPDCFPLFVQATAFNKRAIMNYVSMLSEPRGQASFEVALKYAYQTFEEYEKQADKDGMGMGSKCSKVIIILTDGGVEKPEGLINAKDPSRKYRIFTFAMGKAPTLLEAVKWLACEHGGYFSKINSINTIDAGVQNYIRRLSTAMAHNLTSPDKDSLLSSLYRDEWEYTYALSRLLASATNVTSRGDLLRWGYPDPVLGLGMLTTLTKPVFNTTDNNMTVLGIMGIDVAVEELDKFIPFRELGPLSYTMVVNHNGFVIKHPMLKTQELWNIEPSSLDILDIEVARNRSAKSGIEEVREAMVSRDTSQKIYYGVGAVLQSKDNFAYFLSFTQGYYTGVIPKTAYSLAMAHPRIINKVLMVNRTGDVKILRSIDNYHVTVSKWRYCKGVFSMANQSVVLDRLEKLIGDNISCNPSMVNHLLWDADIVNRAALYRLVKDTDIEAVTMTTAGGLSVLSPQNYGSEKKDDEEDEEEHFILESHYSNNDAKRAFARRDLFIYSAEYSSERSVVEANKTGPTISIHKAITDEEDGEGKGYIFGVMGVIINNTLLTDSLLSVEDEKGKRICNSSADTRCFLLDEGGFILADNIQDEGYSDIGRWVGIVDRSLMHALYNETDDEPSVYRRHKFYDYQATCIYNWKAESSSAAPLPTLYKMMEMFMVQTASALTFLYSTLIMSGDDVYAEPPPLKYGERYQVCTKISYQYFYNDKIEEVDQHQRTITYMDEGCIRMVNTVRLTGTNMLLVIADKPSDACDRKSPMKQAPEEIAAGDYFTADPSVCERHKRRRQAPTGDCLNGDKENHVYLCKGCHRSAVSVALILSAAVIGKLLL